MEASTILELAKTVGPITAFAIFVLVSNWRQEVARTKRDIAREERMGARLDHESDARVEAERVCAERMTKLHTEMMNSQVVMIEKTTAALTAATTMIGSKQSAIETNTVALKRLSEQIQQRKWQPDGE